MGYLIRMWNETPKNFTMSLKQVVSTAGDGFLSDEAAINELRDFFSLIDLHTMERLLGECYLKDKKYKFDTRGFAAQDLINEMGRRLGYKVTNGLYRGRKNEIGFDGIWESDDGSFIVMESKTSDDYSISMESVIGYRDQLIAERKVQKKKCSILIVYGRDDKSGLRNAARGSEESNAIRLISANALFQLVKLVAQSNSGTVQKQVFNLLHPRDYFVLDNLVELVFPQTDADIPDVEETDDADTVIKTFESGKPETNPSDNSGKESQCDERLLSAEEIKNSNKAIGIFVQTDFYKLLNSGRVSKEDIDNLTRREYCDQRLRAKKSVFSMLKEWPEGVDKKVVGMSGRYWRYYSGLVFTSGNRRFLLCSQWYREDYEKLLSWYAEHV